MNKNELIESISRHSGLTKIQARAALNAFILSTCEALCRGETVALAGLGTFSVRERAARHGRNIKTGEAIALPPGKAVHFRRSTSLKQAINGGGN